MIRRTLATRLRRAVQLGGTVLLEGPRGAGKTTLVRAEFPHLTYISMQDPKDRSSARRDPAMFAARLRGSIIIDDVHLAPELARHLADVSQHRAIVLTSSRRLSAPVATLTLYRPTNAELEGRQPLPIGMLGRFVPAETGNPPRAAQWPIAPASIERDVRDLVQFRDLDRFYRFMDVASRMSGQVLDVQKLAQAAGTSRTTAVRWLKILETCFLAIRLEPCDFDFGRRTVRSSKLHFLDSRCFESRVVSELYRNSKHAGAPEGLRYWRDSNGLEVALVYQPAGAPPMGISIVESPNPLDFARIERWMKLARGRSAAMVSARSFGPQRGPILRYALQGL